MAGTIGSLTVFARFNTEAFGKGIKKARSQTKGFSGFVKKNMGAIKGMLAGVAGIAGVQGITNAIGEAEKLQKLSIRLNAPVEELSKLSFAANQSGTSIDSLGQALFRMNRRIGNAATGGGPAARALQYLGLSAKQIVDMPLDQKFMMIVDALGKVEDEAIRNQMGFELLGDNFRDIQPLIAQGTDKIREYMDEAERLGIVVTAEQAAKAAALTDKWNQMYFVIKDIALEIGTALAPALISIMDLMKQFLPTITNTLVPVLKMIGSVTSFVINAIDAVSFKMHALKDSMMGAAAGSMFGPWGALIGGIAAPIIGHMARDATSPKKKAVEVPNLEEIMKDSLGGLAEIGKANNQELKSIKHSVAELPPSLQQGQSATLSFINKLARKDESKRIVDELKRMGKVEKLQLKELKKKRQTPTTFVLRPV